MTILWLVIFTIHSYIYLLTELVLALGSASIPVNQSQPITYRIDNLPFIDSNAASVEMMYLFNYIFIFYLTD